MTKNGKGLKLSFERQLWLDGFGAVAGIDEVGRGCIAGPVVAACVSFPSDHMEIPRIYDSKQLSSPVRERLAFVIKDQASFVGVGVGSVEMIDAEGIVAATRHAMHQAVTSPPDWIFVDGVSAMELVKICPHVEPVVKGDARVYSIAAASIIAKVYRDGLMQTFHGDYPLYGWDHNKGYGTKAHYSALRSFGLTPLHRKSFIHSILDA